MPATTRKQPKVKTPKVKTPKVKAPKAQEPAKDWMPLPSFDASLKPCIPVAMIEEVRPTLLSLSDVIEKAPKIANLTCPSPSTYLGIMRTCVCLVHRLGAPKNVAERERLIRSWIDPKTVRKYFKDNPGAFDLSHTKRPFFQVDPELLSDPTSDMSFTRRCPVNEQSIGKLTLTRSAGTTKAHFDKSFDADPTPLSSPEAAIELMGYQACSMGGGNGGTLDEHGDASSPFITNSNGPGSSSGTSFILVGDTLAQTAALNTLMPEFAEKVVSEAADGPDAPSWERRQSSGRAVWKEISAGWRGPMDFLSLNTKRLSLRAKLDEAGNPVLDADGHAIFNRCLIRQGRGGTLKGRKPAGAPVLNPWYAYATKNGELKPLGRFDRQRDPVWVTGFMGLASGESFRRPLAVEQAAKFGLPCKTLRLRLVGVYHPPGLTGSSVVAFSENEEVEFPIALLNGERVARTLVALEKAFISVIANVMRMILEIDFNGNDYRKATAWKYARDDDAVTYFWETVREHAINGAANDLSGDARWLAELSEIAEQAWMYHARRRGASPETIMGIARALSS